MADGQRHEIRFTMNHEMVETAPERDRPKNTDIDAAAGQRFDLFGRHHFPEIDRDLGHHAAEPRHQLRQHGCGFDEGDRQTADTSGGRTTHTQDGLIHPAQRLRRLLQEDAPGIGQHHVFGAAREKPHAKIGLEPRDLLAECGLRDAQTQCRLGKVKIVRECHERRELPTIHPRFLQANNKYYLF